MFFCIVMKCQCWQMYVWWVYQNAIITCIVYKLCMCVSY